ncbi:unnamed protein product [Prorocentrum cordatum]|uniref:Nucleoplasmin-like domain-containing protein n=1 Tax=Prorocentrum cordatum TaxID=2364126 RepID=A0ABN9SVF3_9DINO|nr:unnamed protein product [Polarella glacialis]
MAFWGTAVKPGTWTQGKAPEGEILHVSQACLHDPKPGKTYLQIQVSGTTYTVACLEKDKREHDALDLMFAPEDAPKFCAKGSSEIHLVGYVEPEQASDEEAAEAAVAPKAAAPKASASPKMLAAAAAKASPKAAPAPSPKAAPAASPKAAAKASPKLAAKKAEAPAEEDDSAESIILEGEEGEEEEPRVKDPVVDADEGPKKGKAAKADAKEAGKRKAPAEAAGGPAAKKAKDDTEPLKPDESEYVQKLVAYLKTNGKTNVSLLGSKVQRPKSLPKLKDILNKHTAKFKAAGSGHGGLGGGPAARGAPCGSPGAVGDVSTGLAQAKYPHTLTVGQFLTILPAPSPHTLCQCCAMAGMDIEAEGSSVTQGMFDLNMAAAPGTQVAAAPAPTAVVETPSAFAALIEHEMLAHFELIQAAQSINGRTVVPRSLDTKMEFDHVLQALACAADAAEPWSVLGLAPSEGPDISLNAIGTRLRFVKLLASVINGASWPEQYKSDALTSVQKISNAAEACFDSFDAWVRERKRARPSKLPLWRELGSRALKVVLDTAPLGTELVGTQWSNLQGAAGESADPRYSSREPTVAVARLLADLAEKGGPAFWDAVKVPRDCIRFFVPLDLHPGCAGVESICDLWWRDLSGDKWPGMALNVDIHPRPFEFISPGPAGPRRELRGLAIFAVSSSLLCRAPRVRDLGAPILAVAALPTCIMVFPSAVGPQETPSGRVEMRFATRAPLVVEVGHAGAIGAFCNVCSGALFFAKSAVLLAAEAAPETWQAAVDAMLQNGPDSAEFKLKRRPSRHGGWQFAAPSALQARLAAARHARQTRGGAASLQAVADVEIKGRLHAGEHALVQPLMQHRALQAGLHLAEQSTTGGPKTSSWKWLSASDPSAPPGRARLFLRDLSEVRAVRDELHDGGARVGMGTFRAFVHNDLRDQVGGADAAS